MPTVRLQKVATPSCARKKVAARAHREKLKQRMERRAQLEQFYKECEETTRRTTAVTAGDTNDSRSWVAIQNIALLDLGKFPKLEF